MRGIETLLKDVPLFAGLDQESIELVAGCGANAHFAADTQVFRQGEGAETFYVVRDGTIALETFVPARGPLMIETLGAGDVVGWSWLFPPYRWHFDARALTPVRATVFEGACLRGKCEDNRDFGYELMSRFAQVMIQRLQWTRLRLLDVYGSGAVN